MGDEINNALDVLELLIANDRPPDTAQARIIAKGAVAFVRELRQALWAIQNMEERTRPNA